jgi:protein-S-isoprenylcysteine O-methyltransferase Ste14
MQSARRLKRLFGAVYFAGLIVEIVVRIPHERQRRQIPKTDRRFTLTERSLLAGLSLALVMPVLHVWTTRLEFADCPMAPKTRARAGGVGSVFLLGALWLFWRAHRDLGDNWSPTLEVGAQQTLITHGVYGRIRHPMYTSQLLIGLAQALLLPNWISGPGGLVTFLALYLFRVPREEQMMLDHFGAAYRAYAARTGRIVPRL